MLLLLGNNWIGYFKKWHIYTTFELRAVQGALFAEASFSNRKHIT